MPKGPVTWLLQCHHMKWRESYDGHVILVNRDSQSVCSPACSVSPALCVRFVTKRFIGEYDRKKGKTY